MAYPQEIKDYAKQLYLTVGPEGDHKYIYPLNKMLRKRLMKLHQPYPKIIK